MAPRLSGSASDRESTKQLTPEDGGKGEKEVMVKQRHCTDLLFLLVFFVSLVGQAFIFERASSQGDVNRILYGMDYMSDLCGLDNSAAANGIPPVVNATFNRPSFLDVLWPWRARPREYTAEVRRGQRDHRARRFLYYTLPTEHFNGLKSTAVCVSSCPHVPDNVTEEDPSTWICTGKYVNGPPSTCPGGLGGAAECVAYRQAFFTRVGPDERARCDDRLSDCDVCFP